MEPLKKIEAERKAILELNKSRQTTCKNAVIAIVDEKFDYGSMKLTYNLSNTGCLNKRRNGSAYCQECSDKHNVKK
jgi:hypothetical protein